MSAEERAGIAAQSGSPVAHRRLVRSLDVLNRIEIVGPPTPSPPPSTRGAGGASLRVAFWNAERGQDLEESLRLLTGAEADVLLLCELDLGMARSGQKHVARELAKALGMGYVFGVEFVELGLGDARERRWHAGSENRLGLHGGAVLSGLALETPAMIRLDEDGSWFDGSRGESRLGGRIAIACSVTLGETRVALVATHLESHGSPEERAAEGAELLDAIDDWHGDGPVVLGGDFNTQSASHAEVHGRPGRTALWRQDPGRFLDPVPYEPIFEAFRARGYGWAASNAGDATQRMRPDGTPPPPHGRLDWLLVRGLRASDPATVPAVDSSGAAISDHELISVTVAPQGEA